MIAYAVRVSAEEEQEAGATMEDLGNAVMDLSTARCSRSRSSGEGDERQRLSR